MSGDLVARRAGDPLVPPVPDALVGAASVFLDVLSRAGGFGVRAAGPGVRLLLEPPLVPASRHPARWVEALARRGRADRAAVVRRRDLLVAAAVPALIDYLSGLVPLTELVRRMVDLDALVADVDLDAIAARLDLDVVAARIDVGAILERIDLTQVVTERVDLDAVARGLDLDAVIGRVDLAALANEVIAAIDLPEIIRESSGSLASETVRSVRMQGIDADRAVERLIDRLRRHRALRPDDGPAGSAAT